MIKSKDLPPTYRELAKWIAQGYGEYKNLKDNPTVCYSGKAEYNEENANHLVGEHILVRKWCDTEWHNPTRGYCSRG